MEIRCLFYFCNVCYDHQRSGCKFPRVQFGSSASSSRCFNTVCHVIRAALITIQCSSTSRTLTPGSCTLSPFLKWEGSERPGQFGQRHRNWLHGVTEERAGEAATETLQRPRSDRRLLRSCACCPACIGLVSEALMTSPMKYIRCFYAADPMVFAHLVPIPSTCKENAMLAQRFDNRSLTNYR